MPRGRQPAEYFDNPFIDKPIEQIYADFDSYTHELLEGDAVAKKGWMRVVLPPLCYKGEFLKGLCFSPCVDAFIEHCPDFSKLFNTMAISMAISYPFSTKADAYLVSYDNPQREEWFKQHASIERAGKTLIPLADADFTNEQRFVPLDLPHGRPIDVLTVSVPTPQKNIPLITEAVSLLAERKLPLNMTLITGKPLAERSPANLAELALAKKRFGRNAHLFDDVPIVNPALMWLFYGRAKVYVLGSLFEGSNRSIKEALCCNTPVICFRQYNQYARGNTKIFADGCGLLAEFGAEPLADAIEYVLKNPSAFHPRDLHIQQNGRRHFFNKCINSLPYYKECLVGYTPEGDHFANQWLSAAIADNYSDTLQEFIYSEADCTYAQGFEGLRQCIDFYSTRVKNSGGCFNQ